MQADHRSWAGSSRRRRSVLCCAGLLACLFAGCASYGPRRLPADRFDYNAAIASSSNEQMLINLVRMRFGEAPTFLAVSSVLTQYVWTADVGVAGAGGESLGDPAWTIGGSAGARYIERPTVTYTPLSGQEFAAQLLSPVRADVVFSLVSSGWPPDELLSMTIQRINDVRNIDFSDPKRSTEDDAARFGRLIDLIIALSRRDAIELVRAGQGDEAEAYLEIDESPDAQTGALIAELQETLGLDPALSRYEITRRIIGRSPDKITIRMHSLLELMGLLSGGVQEPGPGGAIAAEAARRPLVIRRHAEPPDDALVTVRYGAEWYSIARTDETSKRAFGLLIYLFQMQASQGQGIAPVLTVPVG